MSVTVEVGGHSIEVDVQHPTIEVEVSGPPGPPGIGMDQAAADARYVNADGDTMTGSLAMTGADYQSHVVFYAVNGIMWVGQTPQVYVAPGYGAGLAVMDISGAPLPLAVGAPALVNHVPHLARTPNALTGDLGLPGYMGSDTGWRTLCSWDAAGTVTGSFTFHAGWGPYVGVPGFVRVKRIGQEVILWAEMLKTTADGPGEMFDQPLPPGFYGTQESSGLMGNSTTSPWSLSVVNNGQIGRSGNAGIAGDVLCVSGAHSRHHIGMTAWPTSLPGTQFTPPAAWT